MSDDKRGEVFSVGEPPQQWQTNFWERLRQRDTDADFDETGKRVITGDLDSDYVEGA